MVLRWYILLCITASNEKYPAPARNNMKKIAKYIRAGSLTIKGSYA